MVKSKAHSGPGQVFCLTPKFLPRSGANYLNPKCSLLYDLVSVCYSPHGRSRVSIRMVELLQSYLLVMLFKLLIVNW